MRSIKFRVWNENTKTMTQVFGAWFEEQGDYQQEELAKFGNLMQFSGICDHKGVEIYEGDILKCHDGNWRVYFSSGSFRTRNGRRYGTVYNMYKPEVVGNIYQNAKLY